MKKGFKKPNILKNYEKKLNNCKTRKPLKKKNKPRVGWVNKNKKIVFANPDFDIPLAGRDPPWYRIRQFYCGPQTRSRQDSRHQVLIIKV